MIKDLKDVLCCPTCREKLVYEKEFIYCPNCKEQVLMDNRLLDFSHMLPDLPLDLAKYIQALTEDAGQLMKDVEIDWRVKSVLGVVKEIAQGAGAVCLEIGGGDGPMTPTLERIFDHVLTIDYSKTFLKRIESKTTKTICLLGDAHFLPLQDNSIDLIVCSEVLEHATIPTQLLTELRRVIKKDRTVILSVPNEATLHIRRRKLKYIPASDTHINFFTPETVEKLVFRTGFEVAAIQTIFPPNNSLKALLRNIKMLLSKGFQGPYILCILRLMDDPWIYWESFYGKLGK